MFLLSLPLPPPPIPQWRLSMRELHLLPLPSPGPALEHSALGGLASRASGAGVWLHRSGADVCMTQDTPCPPLPRRCTDSHLPLARGLHYSLRWWVSALAFCLQRSTLTSSLRSCMRSTLVASSQSLQSHSAGWPPSPVLIQGLGCGMAVVLVWSELRRGQDWTCTPATSKSRSSSSKERGVGSPGFLGGGLWVG